MGNFTVKVPRSRNRCIATAGRQTDRTFTDPIGQVDTTLLMVGEDGGRSAPDSRPLT
jgi:hypothetical protein